MTVLDSYRELERAQKGRARSAPAYSIYVNRPVGRVFASLAHAVGMTPNQVTGVSALLTFTGVVLLAAVPPSAGLGIGVWLLLAVGYAWDSADGQVARLRGGGSPAGEWLDHVVDAAKLVSLHVAVTVGVFRFFDLESPVWLLVPLLFAIISTVTFFGMILNDLLRARHGVEQAAQSGGSSPLRSLMGLPTDYGVLCFLFVLWGWQAGFMLMYSLAALAGLFFLIAALVVWFRKMKALG